MITSCYSGWISDSVHGNTFSLCVGWQASTSHVVVFSSCKVCRFLLTHACNIHSNVNEWVSEWVSVCVCVCVWYYCEHGWTGSTAHVQQDIVICSKVHLLESKEHANVLWDWCDGRTQSDLLFVDTHFYTQLLIHDRQREIIVYIYNMLTHCYSIHVHTTLVLKLYMIDIPFVYQFTFSQNRYVYSLWYRKFYHQFNAIYFEMWDNHHQNNHQNNNVSNMPQRQI